ncbi:MAG: NAD-dependent protein deacylase [Candidatus Lokiarchaeota archaeon]|nr:NAD-dependent protein deacylase [Candidatus Lokiarchaeota archaeon]
MDSELNKKIELSIKILKNSKNIVALTGAGISTESGIPDFRSPGTGLWTKNDPMKYASIDAFLENPASYWERAIDPSGLGNKILDSEPSKSHLALAELEKIGLLKSVITQNIDNLHQKAGNTDVIELHGTIFTAHCMNCKTRYKRRHVLEWVKEGELPPLCKKDGCEGILKSDTILFGESLPQDALSRAIKISRNCDCMIVLGSSLVVTPAAHLPILAVKNGAELIIINIQKTPKDHLARIVINQKIGKVIPKIIDKLKD